MKDIRDGTKLNERFRSDEKVERVRLDQKDYQFLYADGDLLHFMDQETYEQIPLNADILDGQQRAFLQENMIVVLESYEGNPISVEIPEHVTLAITEADAVVKGQTGQLLLQARHAGKWRARDGAAAYRGWHAGSSSMCTSRPTPAARTDQFC